jgi:hypothetical protein
MLQFVSSKDQKSQGRCACRQAQKHHAGGIERSPGSSPVGEEQANKSSTIFRRNTHEHTD